MNEKFDLKEVIKMSEYVKVCSQGLPHTTTANLIDEYLRIKMEQIKKDVPPNIMELVEGYKNRIREINKVTEDDEIGELHTIGYIISLKEEKVTLNKVIDDLSAWIIHNY